MIMDYDGWITTDSLISILAVLILTTSLINIVVERVDTVNSMEEAFDARVLGENIAEQIQTTNSNGPGYYTTYRTPGNISDEYYTVHINSSGLFILVDKKICYSHLGSIRVSGSDYLRDLMVTMKPGKVYNISNTRDRLKNTWIIIKEV
jgi:hypothetical protein